MSYPERFIFTLEIKRKYTTKNLHFGRQKVIFLDFRVLISRRNFFQRSPGTMKDHIGQKFRY